MFSVANFKNCQMGKKEKCFDPVHKTTVYAFQNEMWNESSLSAGINNSITLNNNNITFFFLLLYSWKKVSMKAQMLNKTTV